MKRVVLLLSGILVAMEAPASCDTFPVTYKVSAPLTIAQIEAESLKELSKSGNTKVPKVPFGYQNQQWLEFKAAAREGDAFVRFESEETSWRQLHGQAGYARMRNGCIEARILTRMS